MSFFRNQQFMNDVTSGSRNSMQAQVNNVELQNEMHKLNKKLDRLETNFYLVVDKFVKEGKEKHEIETLLKREREEILQITVMLNDINSRLNRRPADERRISSPLRRSRHEKAYSIKLKVDEYLNKAFN